MVWLTNRWIEGLSHGRNLMPGIVNVAKKPRLVRTSGMDLLLLFCYMDIYLMGLQIYIARQ